MVGTVVAIVIVAAVVVLLSRTVRVIQQGSSGVIKRLGQFHGVRAPGLAVVVPFVDQMVRVDMREVPRTGDRQDVITKDNVSVAVNATIFSQVVDVKLALYDVSNYQVAVDQLARTSLRAVFGGLTLDEALSDRERINAELQRHMSPAAEKWGVRLNRIEIVDILPPQQILNAMALQKEADQQKRAAILKSEGEQQAAINSAQGQRTAAILRAEGDKQATILRAEAQKQAAILAAEGSRESQALDGEGRATAISSVYQAIHQARPTPELLAVLQLDTLGKLVASDNAKVVVPVETAALLGASQALRAVLADVPGTSPAPDGAGVAPVADGAATRSGAGGAARPR
ncbi:MAG TPA: SPFH domain-containing protein [Candidatus Micrarchaeia archaeon]|nr:SPFH domain-containing protein [Candidatus Micrarchaeia archaeon]